VPSYPYRVRVDFWDFVSETWIDKNLWVAHWSPQKSHVLSTQNVAARWRQLRGARACGFEVIARIHQEATMGQRARAVILRGRREIAICEEAVPAAIIGR